MRELRPALKQIVRNGGLVGEGIQVDAAWHVVEVELGHAEKATHVGKKRRTISVLRRVHAVLLAADTGTHAE